MTFLKALTRLDKRRFFGYALSTFTYFTMSYTISPPEKSEVTLTITVTPSDYEKHLKRAAERLSSRVAVHGFRPGNVPYDIMRREAGSMAILQEALEPIIQESFVAAVKAETLETVGMPRIRVEKIAPDNNIVYTAAVALFPAIMLADLGSIKVLRTVKPIEESSLDEAVTALRGMQANETEKDGSAEKTDKLVIDMDMTLDHIPVEGGQARDYQVYLSEDHAIPGFNAELHGLKKGDEKKFRLTFPEAHYQKMLAGKTVDFSVRVKGVFMRDLPPADDVFAKKLGQPSLADLRALLKKNMETEASEKADQRAEIELLDSLILQSSFDPIPEILIDAELQKMFFELKRDLEKNGVTIEQYLSDIKKTEKELRTGFREQAEKRAKAALVSRTVAKEQNIVATPEEIDQEIIYLTEHYREDAGTRENLRKPEVRDTIASMIQNRKVMAWLKEKILHPAA